MTTKAKMATGPISEQASSPYQRYQEVSAMRRVLLGLVTALLVAGVACSAAGTGGGGSPQNATPAPSSKPGTGGPSADPEYGY